MKVIKDAMMKWLDDEIEKESHLTQVVSASRWQILEEVRTKLTEIIVEEFSKMEHPHD